MQIIILLLLAWISSHVEAARTEKKRPHIVFIAVDDLVSKDSRNTNRQMICEKRTGRNSKENFTGLT